MSATPILPQNHGLFSNTAYVLNKIQKKSGYNLPDLGSFVGNPTINLLCPSFDCIKKAPSVNQRSPTGSKERVNIFIIYIFVCCEQV